MRFFGNDAEELKALPWKLQSCNHRAADLAAMFTNFNFSALADLNINERLQQIKHDLEANIESSLGIDHAALAALTGDGESGASVV